MTQMQNIFVDPLEDIDADASIAQPPERPKERIIPRGVGMQPNRYNSGAAPVQYARTFAPVQRPRHFRKKLSEG